MKITRVRVKSGKRKPARKPSVNDRGETPKQELERLRKMSHETFYLRGFYAEVMQDIEKIVRKVVNEAVNELTDEIRYSVKGY